MSETAYDRFERLAAAFQTDTGLMAPGKDSPAALGSDNYDARVAAWRAWNRGRVYGLAEAAEPLAPAADGERRLTFEDLVAHGIASGANLHDGMPWSFQIPVTHEHDDCYLICTAQGTLRFNRGDVLTIATAAAPSPAPGPRADGEEAEICDLLEAEPTLRVRVLRPVRSDLPAMFGPTLSVEPGIHDAHINRLGAVAVVTINGDLGVKPGEFELDSASVASLRNWALDLADALAAIVTKEPTPKPLDGEETRKAIQALPLFLAVEPTEPCSVVGVHPLAWADRDEPKFFLREFDAQEFFAARSQLPAGEVLP